MIMLDGLMAFQNLVLKVRFALASVAQLLGASAHNQKVAGLIPVRAHTWLVCLIPGPSKPPVWAHTGGNPSTLLSHIDVSFSLSLPLSLPLSLKAMKKYVLR